MKKDLAADLFNIKGKPPSRSAQNQAQMKELALISLVKKNNNLNRVQYNMAKSGKIWIFEKIEQS